MRLPKTKVEIGRLGVSNVRNAYYDLSTDYNRILNLDFVYCPYCGNWKSSKAFYGSNKTVSGLEHYACKECILDMCTDKDKDGNRVDNREKTIDTFKKLDWVFVDSDYQSQLKSLNENIGERNRPCAAAVIITMTRSLPQYRGKTFADSDFGTDGYGDTVVNAEESSKITQRTIKNAKKRFGSSYTNEELMFLEDEYQDWVSRYECNQKAQEETFENLSILKLMKRNAIKNNKSTKELDYSYQQWLDTGNLKPKQNALDTLSDAQTLGTLIKKYEDTRPLPEIDPELEDVDKIGLYIDAFYRGHAAKMLGLKNRFTQIYERVMSKYTVEKPSYDEENDSEVLFEKIFGNKDE